MGNYLTKDDYEEPRCLLCMDQGPERIPLRRIISTLDTHLGKNDYAAAERLLKHWIMEADYNRDMEGKLSMLNEQIGLYRKLGRKEECFEAIENVLALIDTLDMENTITYGTTMVNVATGYKAFGKAKEALPYYRKAQDIYEKNLELASDKTGALYNNMALALTELGEYREAESYYYKALDIMKDQENGELEMAITYLNLADLITAESGHEENEEKICEFLDKAEELLNTESVPRNGYYAFVCEKCAPSFEYYGYFITAKELKEVSNSIYLSNQ